MAVLGAWRERIDASRRRVVAAPEVTNEAASAVVIAGALCCALGWRIAPAGTRADGATTWNALVLGMIFWGSACVAAAGLYLRLRRGLLAALVCASSFAATIVVAAVLDSSVLGVRWAVELTCAIAFGAVCVASLVLTGRARRRALRPAAARPSAIRPRA